MTRALAPYLATFGSRFREEMQYRAAAIAGVVTQIVFGFLVLMVLRGFYESSTAPSPMTPGQILAYVWLSQALLGMLPWNVDPLALNAIRTGDVAKELLRPVSLYRMWFANSLAWRVVRSTLRCFPLVVMAMVVFPRIGLRDFAMPAPASFGAFFLFAVAVGLAALLSAAITVLMQVVMVWTVSPDGVLKLLPPFTTFFAGNLVPLPLLPAWMQPFLKFQPFRGLADTPFRIYSGSLAGSEALIAISLSAGWLAVLILLGAWILRLGIRRLEVAGG